MSKKKQETAEPETKEVEEQYEELLIEQAKENIVESDEKISISEIKDVPGLGKKSQDVLAENNILTIDQLMTTRLIELQTMGIQRATIKKARATISKSVAKYKYFKEELGLEDLPGVGKSTADMLREKGLNVYLLETTPIRELEDKYGITETASKKYKEGLNELRGGVDFINAFEIMERQTN
ncbi:MAG: hypothetical protein H7647_09950, partial [Candidatus Heimdallarchaeota archaeon]|nr:hypothetical protein [Candidatus Heimdallarchaeota archaeon]MCK4254748.1 hypothetical protein [Candidatus Heimdallarchaeota archaeon]